MTTARKIVFELDRGDILPVRDARGARIRCLAGRLWITQQDDPNDIVVGPGEAYELGRDGHTLVQAMEVSRVAVEIPRALPRQAFPATLDLSRAAA